MTRRVFFHWDGVYLSLIRTEGFTPGPGAEITVREPDADQIPWGVWVNGERSHDTWVLVNGQALAARSNGVLCRSMSDDVPAWDQHEERGGGRPVLAYL